MQYIMYNIRYLYIFYAVPFFFLLVKLNAFILMFHAKHFDIFTAKTQKVIHILLTLTVEKCIKNRNILRQTRIFQYCFKDFRVKYRRYKAFFAFCACISHSFRI